MGLFSRKYKTSDDTPKDAKFFFYFDKDNKAAAQKAEKEFSEQGFKTDLHWLDYEEGQWSLTLNKQVQGLGEVSALEKTFEPFIKKYAADYDGHEIEA